MKFFKYLVVGVGLCCAQVQADEVSDAIREALQAYQSGDYSMAVSNLNYATQLVQQLKSDQLATVAPPPLQGWQASEVKKSAAGAMYGGGVSIERSYTKGDSTVELSITADAPMLQGFLMMMNNPMMLSGGNGRLTKIAGHKAIVEFSNEDRSGQVTIVHANRFLIQISGNGVDQDTLRRYAEKVGFSQLEQL